MRKLIFLALLMFVSIAQAETLRYVIHNGYMQNMTVSFEGLNASSDSSNTIIPHHGYKVVNITFNENDKDNLPSFSMKGSWEGGGSSIFDFVIVKPVKESYCSKEEAPYDSHAFLFKNYTLCQSYQGFYTKDAPVNIEGNTTDLYFDDNRSA